jgi:sterol desaturase/sphingolipid hydroxylase (fatty acid hydroxylase superfamily)
MTMDSARFLLWYERKLLLVGAGLLALLVIGEMVADFRSGRRSYSRAEALASVAVGVAARLVTLAEAGVMAAACFFFWQYRIAEVPLGAVWGWVALLFAYEFFYYLYHRAAHSIRWLWASHTVHHSPEHLSVVAAFRLCISGLLAGHWLAVAPLILLGFHPVAVMTMMYVNVLYQFWIHNETIPKLGVLEYVLNTPSNHRVHHALNEPYLDHNFGGILIIYDRLFGTYVAESERVPCRYGLLGEPPGNNPAWIAVREWLAMAHDVRSSRSLGEALGYMLRRPGWQPKRRLAEGAEARP